MSKSMEMVARDSICERIQNYGKGPAESLN